MKAGILAGCLGTRLAEETHLRPKPMVEVGGKPILWHILKTYSHHGINEFIIYCGYKGYIIKEYFANYFLHTSDVTFHMDLNHMEIHKQNAEPWKVTLMDTGEATLTAVQPPGRYGVLVLDGHQVHNFQEKRDGDGGWINGGYFVLEPSVLELIDGDSSTWERPPLNALADSQLKEFAGLLGSVTFKYSSLMIRKSTSREGAPW